ncbi:MAG: methyltransferase domain-containing protein [Candidatus Thermoplasmatota archaeon]
MIEKGEKLVLWNHDNATLVKVDGETKKISGLGVIDTDRFVGKRWGTEVKIGRERYRLLQPALKDGPELIDREAQIILPHIGVQMALYCDITSGKRVVEGGAGSGMFSAVLSKMIGPKGELVTYEIREDFIKTARSNLEKLDLDENWKLVKGDVTEDVEERNVDAFVVDIPEPWEALDMADKSIKDGGFFAGYVPSTNQLEKTVKGMRQHDYVDIKSFESLERDMVVGEKGVRPSFEMLGHTGYVAVGRKTP